MTPLEEHTDKAMARGGLRDLIREMMGQLSHSEEQKIFNLAAQWGDRRAAFERESCALMAEAISLLHLAHPSTPDGGLETAKRAIANAIRARK